MYPWMYTYLQFLIHRSARKNWATFRIFALEQEDNYMNKSGLLWSERRQKLYHVCVMTVIQDTRPCNIRALSTFVTGTALPSQVYKRSQKCFVTQRGTDGPLFFDVGGGGGWGVGRCGDKFAKRILHSGNCCLLFLHTASWYWLKKAGKGEGHDIVRLIKALKIVYITIL